MPESSFEFRETSAHVYYYLRVTPEPELRTREEIETGTELTLRQVDNALVGLGAVNFVDKLRFVDEHIKAPAINPGATKKRFFYSNTGEGDEQFNTFVQRKLKLYKAMAADLGKIGLKE